MLLPTYPSHSSENLYIFFLNLLFLNILNLESLSNLPLVNDKAENVHLEHNSIWILS